MLHYLTLLGQWRLTCIVCQLWIPDGQAGLGYLTKVCGCIHHAHIVGGCLSKFLSALSWHKCRVLCIKVNTTLIAYTSSVPWIGALSLLRFESPPRDHGVSLDHSCAHQPAKLPERTALLGKLRLENFCCKLGLSTANEMGSIKCN